MPHTPSAHTPSTHAISCALLATILAATPVLAAPACGDPDGNGVTNILDSLFLARAATGLIMPTPSQFAVGDVNGDRSLTVIDALWTAQRSAGLLVYYDCDFFARFQIEPIGVVPNPGTHGTLTYEVTAGQTLDLRITALDPLGARDLSFVGTVDVYLTGTTDTSGMPVFTPSFSVNFTGAATGQMDVLSSSLPMGIGFARSGVDLFSIECSTLGPPLTGSLPILVHPGPVAVCFQSSSDGYSQIAGGGAMIPTPVPVVAPTVLLGAPPSPTTPLPAVDDPLSGNPGERDWQFFQFTDMYGNGTTGMVQAYCLNPAVMQVVHPVTGLPVTFFNRYPDLHGLVAVEVEYIGQGVAGIGVLDQATTVGCTQPLTTNSPTSNALGDSLVEIDVGGQMIEIDPLNPAYMVPFYVTVNPLAPLLPGYEIQWFYQYEGAPELPLGAAGSQIQVQVPGPGGGGGGGLDPLRRLYLIAKLIELATGSSLSVETLCLLLSPKVTLPLKVFLRDNATLTAPEFTGVSDKVNKIYAQAGVCFNFMRCDVPGDAPTPVGPDMTQEAGFGDYRSLTADGLAVSMSAGFPVSLSQIQVFFFDNTGGGFNGLAESNLNPASGVQECFVDGPGTAASGIGGFRPEVMDTADCKIGVTLAHELWHMISQKYDPEAGATPDENSLTDSQVTGTNISPSEALKINRCAQMLFP